MYNDDTLPLDEMDPCCRKEIENEKHKDRVKRELRKTDRSNVRHDIKAGVMSKLKKSGSSCACCNASGDYPALARLRRLAEAQEAAAHERKGEKEDREAAREEEEDEDDEFAALCLDVGLTEFEQERMLQMKEQARAVEAARALGYTSHKEESVEHLAELVKRGQTVVCHVFEKSSPRCAALDLVLEKLARKYVGTKFRRVEKSASLSRYLEGLHSSNTPFSLSAQFAPSFSSSSTSASVFASGQWKAAEAGGGEASIICFSNCDVCLFENTSVLGGDEENVYESDVETYFSHAHVLLVLPPFEFGSSSASKGSRRRDQLGGVGGEGEEEEVDEDEEVDSDLDDGEEDEASRSYCDEPECGRNFPHTHVGGGGGGGLVSKSLERGSEALAKEEMLRV